MSALASRLGNNGGLVTCDQIGFPVEVGAGPNFFAPYFFVDPQGPWCSVPRRAAHSRPCGEKWPTLGHFFSPGDFGPWPKFLKYCHPPGIPLCFPIFFQAQTSLLLHQSLLYPAGLLFCFGYFSQKVSSRVQDPFCLLESRDPNRSVPLCLHPLPSGTTISRDSSRTCRPPGMRQSSAASRITVLGSPVGL